MAAGWELTTEQSDQKAYAKQDLMTSNATALIGENGNYSLSFQLTHRMSLVVVKLPSTRYIFTDAEGVAMPEETPYVAMPVDVAFYLDNVEEGTKFLLIMTQRKMNIVCKKTVFGKSDYRSL